MPPLLATVLTLGFIAWLFRRDMRLEQSTTSALWVPFIWIFLCSSRGVSEWLTTFTGIRFGGALEEGSPIDRLFWIIMILAGIGILRRRQVQLSTLMRNNQWLAAFLIYCLLAVLWSDFPFVALKRWIKVLGNPIMVLIIMTEPDPKRAFVTVMKRCAYIVLPVSILFIKYFPQWGRGFSAWTGAALNTGITMSKNILGVDCLIYAFFFVWYLLNLWAEPRSRTRRSEIWLSFLFLFMAWWLFGKADSQTPGTAFIIGVCVLLFVSSRFVSRQMVGTYVIIGLICLVFLEGVFDLYHVLLRFLGRNPTLTDRTLLWADLLKEPINPLLGAGFESFWLGERLRRIWQRWTFGPNQAHNGYLETYLNLGLIGLAMLVGLLLATYAKARRAWAAGVEFGRFRLGFLAAILAYNWTEAAFKTTHIVFLMFYVVTIDLPRRSTPAVSTRGAPVPFPPRPREVGPKAAKIGQEESVLGAGIRKSRP